MWSQPPCRCPLQRAQDYYEENDSWQLRKDYAEESRGKSNLHGARALEEDGNLRSSCRKNLMPLGLGEHGQSRGEEKCEQQNHADLDTAVLRHTEQDHDGRH